MKNTDGETSHRILVIDDNPDIHEDFRKILCGDRSNTALDAAEAALFGTTPGPRQQARFEVDSAYQGEHGLARVNHAVQEGRPYEIAFVDVRMPPGWDGIEVTPKLWIADPDLQIVICTAYSDYTWEEMFAKVGTSDRMYFLQKPFDRAEVLQFAHTLTARRRSTSRREANPSQIKKTGESLTTEIIRLKQSQSAKPGATGSV
jgi:CheY-like chemotaxis protein